MRVLVNPIFRLLFLLAITGALILSVTEGSAIKTRVSNIIFDSYLNIKPRDPSDRIIFADIDDISLSKVGQWPWPRNYLAEIVRNLKASGATAIAFDGVLAEPDRTSPENIAALLAQDHLALEELGNLPSHDQILAEAIKEVGNFITGFSHGSNINPPVIKKGILIKKDVQSFFLAQKGSGSVYFKSSAQFLPEIQESAAGNGSFMASAESDAVIRRTGLIFHDGKVIYPSLILEALRLDEKGFIKISENKDYSNYKISEPFHVLVGKYKIPLDTEGKMWIYYRRLNPSKEKISIYKFLDSYYASEKQDLTGKIIFIGSSAEGLMDLRATPLGMQPGVNVHINAFEQILQNKFLIRPYAANVLEIIFAASICLFLILLSFFVNPIWLSFIAFLSSAGAFILSWNLFAQYGALFDPIAPALMIAVIFTISSILSFLKTEIEKQQVRQAFSLYISPDFMKELTKNPEKLSLGGESKELTIMFTDIRKFTTICEGLTPSEIIHLMNDFLTPMSDLVMSNRGTIDKYMGDAMMAFWNAPLDDPNHARHACQAALGMQAALEPINKGIAEKAIKVSKNPVLLQAGIGVNTGPCAVGNMGSKQRFAYSTLGDAVNLASRLESQTKYYGVGILIGENTKEQVLDFAYLEADLIQVKGKTQPVKIYILLGDDNLARTPEFIDLQKSHARMIKNYQAGKFVSALSDLEECTKASFSLNKYYELYRERLEKFIKNSPENWDGIYIAQDK